MKKIVVLMIVMVMSLGLVACDSMVPANEKSEEAVVTEKTEKETTKEEATDDKKEEVQEEVTKEEVEEKTEEKTEEVANDVEIDTSLTDLALLYEIAIHMPETIITTTKSAMTDGSEMISLMYKDGENYRMESTSQEGGTQIMIYNDELGESYMYSVGEEHGILSTDGEDLDEDGMGESFDVDLDGATYADLFEDEDMPNVKANVEKLDGEDVVHVETFSEDEGATMVVHNWYNMKYMVAMKTEMYMNDALVMSSVVSDIQVNTKIDPKMFAKPEGVEFVAMPF